MGRGTKPNIDDYALPNQPKPGLIAQAIYSPQVANRFAAQYECMRRDIGFYACLNSGNSNSPEGDNDDRR